MTQYRVLVNLSYEPRKTSGEVDLSKAKRFRPGDIVDSVVIPGSKMPIGQLLANGEIEEVI